MNPSHSEICFIRFLTFLVVLTSCADRDDPDWERRRFGDGYRSGDANGDGPGDVGLEVTAAIPGARCNIWEQVGQVTISGVPNAAWAWAWLADGPNPIYTEPALSTAHCNYHEYVQQNPCPECPEGETCASDGSCVRVPRLATTAQLVLSANEQNQVLAADSMGTMQGEITLPGSAFSLELVGHSVEVTLAETSLPGALADLTGTLSGSYDHPTAIDITWTPPEDGGHVFTHIPINHHAFSVTFTECAVDASTGALHVDEDMLVPLAVATGLEFQGIEHINFAAAETRLGCIEIRYARPHYVELGN
ncbi:hypothetical protein ACFL6C_06840 [Myxococcota bacterium]